MLDEYCIASYLYLMYTPVAPVKMLNEFSAITVPLQKPCFNVYVCTVLCISAASKRHDLSSDWPMLVLAEKKNPPALACSRRQDLVFDWLRDHTFQK